MSLPKSKDLSHLLSVEASGRKSSPLKTAFKYFGDPNVVFLGGGLPLADYFPFDSVSSDIPKPPFSNGIGAKISGEDVDTTKVHVEKFIKAEDNTFNDVQLSTSLQYGYTEGSPYFVSFVKEHTKLIHKPAYEDWGVISTIGNTQSWDATLRTFCERGDSILTEEYSFSSSLEAASAQGVITVPIAVDDFGIVPEALEKKLDNWVGKKPKLLYTIPTGQNPTGSCLSEERRRAIYALAQKHDFIIIEDEPYYFLQMEAYTKDVAAREGKAVHSHEAFVDALVASFISIDTEGRVIRLDSFSKVIAPGTRLGWIVAQQPLLERYVRLHEVSIQAPSGFTQTLVNGLLQRWGQKGYLDWLIGLRHEYTHKRDVAVDAILKNFPSEVTNICPPVAGMFFTVNIDAAKHPKFATEFGSDPIKVETAIYEKALETGCLMIPGSWFKVKGNTNPPQPEEPINEETKNHVFFRGTYAAVPLDKLTAGLEKFGEAVKIEYGL